MDEPFASLDYDTKNAIYEYIQRIRKDENLSIIIVTHQYEEAKILADNYMWMDEGKIRMADVSFSLNHAQFAPTYRLEEEKKHH